MTRHLSVSLSKNDYREEPKVYFGGSFALSTEHFILVNGFSNEFWGWGGEDDDIMDRLKYKKFKIIRYSADIARFDIFLLQ